MRFRRAFARVERRFLPPAIGLGRRLDRRRARILLAYAGMLAALGPVFAALSHVLGPPGFAPALAAATAAAVVAPVVLRRTGSVQAAGLVLVGAYFLVLVWGGAVSGGLNTPALWWLAAAPMLATTILGRRWGAFFAALAGAVYAAFFGLTAAGLLPPQARPDAVGPANILVTLLGLAYLVWSLLWISETSRVYAERGLARANRRLREEIGRRRRAQAEVERLARYDALTRLPNRRMFEEALAKAFARARAGGEPFALLMLDLDHFKRINDTLGHPAGDELLAQAAERLAGALRPADLAARLGGDEFAVLLRGGRPDAELAASVAERLIAALSAPYRLRAGEARAGASAGVALYAPGLAEASAVIRRADDALYAAKRGGRGVYRFYEEAEAPGSATAAA